MSFGTGLVAVLTCLVLLLGNHTSAGPAGAVSVNNCACNWTYSETTDLPPDYLPTIEVILGDAEHGECIIDAMTEECDTDH